MNPRFFTLITLAFIAICGSPVGANEIRHQVKRSSDLERELALKISVMDKHDSWRADGLDKVFAIDGESPEYLVRFETTPTGKLKDLFGLGLSLSDAGIESNPQHLSSPRHG
jgi:hypothetical protein